MQGHNEVPERDKERYAPPRLEVLGTLEELTLGPTGSGQDLLEGASDIIP